MIERSFDEMIGYFNRRVSEMDIDREYKIELFAMVTALGYRHEKSTQHWIPCSERLPEAGKYGLRTIRKFGWHGEEYWSVDIGPYNTNDGSIIAWMPLPEPYKEIK